MTRTFGASGPGRGTGVNAGRDSAIVGPMTARAAVAASTCCAPPSPRPAPRRARPDGTLPGCHPRRRSPPAGSGAEADDVGHLALGGVEPHVGPVALPDVGVAGQLVGGLVGAVPGQAHGPEVEV